MINFEHINPEQITEDGLYYNAHTKQYYKMRDEDLLAARKYFRNPYLGWQRTIPSKRKKVSKKSPRYKVDRNQKYNNGKCKTKDDSYLRGLVKVVAGGVAVSTAILGVIGLTGVEDIFDTKFEVDQLGKETGIVSQVDEVPGYNPVVTGSDSTKGIRIKGLSTTPSEENHVEKEYIRKYCDIYHLDFEQVYNKIVELTENFQSHEYLNELSLDGVTCKGEQVYAKTPEELMLYTVRMIKFSPGRFGLNGEDILKEGYESNTDYTHQLAYYANILGVDPALAYGIIRSETNWNSPMFNSINNPAGLKLNGDWWEFATKEAGFIELMLEILKYNRMGAYSIEEISTIHCPLDDPEDYNNVNHYWVDNVTEWTNYATEHYEELFGKKIENSKSIGY